MHYLKNELRRVEKYAEGLGIKIVYKKQRRSDPEAAWSVDGSEITVYLRNRQSTTQIILDLIHELGHHIHWVYNNRKIPLELDKALGKESHTKKDREKILYDEINGGQYHLIIYNELGLKIPKWKVEVERDLAIESYKYYYKNNEEIPRKLVKEKRIELIKKYKGC